MTWQDRIRELVGPGVLIAALGAGVAGSGAPAAGSDVIRVGAFNVQVFGQTKASHPEIMDVLARVAREYDVLLVEEVRDADLEVADRFLEAINRTANPRYSMVEGPRLGRTNSKEQYVIYYRPPVAFVDSFTVPDPDDRFEREPLVARFQAGSFDFRLVGAHIKPEDARDELAALADVAGTVADSAEGDVILLGDFNADCSYLNENDMSLPLRAAPYHWVIDNSVGTAVSSGCTYDRMVLLDGTFGHEYVPNSARVFRYDQEFGITDQDSIKRVSDHFPIVAEFRITGPDDDGPGGPVLVATTGFVASKLGHYYYQAGCNAARRLSPANLVSFATEADAEQGRYRRSTASGC